MNHWLTKTQEQRRAISAKGIATRRQNKIAAQEAQEKALLLRDSLHCEIELLKERLEKLQKAEVFSINMAEITGKALLTEAEICAGARPKPRLCGVYFLVHNDEVAYVGQSRNLLNRIASHSNKEYDKIAYLPCPEDSLDRVESLYIHCLRPKYNREQSPGVKVAPISLSNLLAI